MPRTAAMFIDTQMPSQDPPPRTYPLLSTFMMRHFQCIPFLSRDPCHFASFLPPSHFVTLFGLILFRNAYRRAKQASEIRPDPLMLVLLRNLLSQSRRNGNGGIVSFHILVEEFWNVWNDGKNYIIAKNSSFFQSCDQISFYMYSIYACYVDFIELEIFWIWIFRQG